MKQQGKRTGEKPSAAGKKGGFPPRVKKCIVMNILFKVFFREF